MRSVSGAQRGREDTPVDARPSCLSVLDRGSGSPRPGVWLFGRVLPAGARGRGCRVLPPRERGPRGPRGQGRRAAGSWRRRRPLRIKIISCHHTPRDGAARLANLGQPREREGPREAPAAFLNGPASLKAENSSWPPVFSNEYPDLPSFVYLERETEMFTSSFNFCKYIFCLGYCRPVRTTKCTCISF